jgi:hypothetical protein
MKNLLLLASLSLLITSCATVDSGHKGVEVSWGGETNLQEVHGEGMNSGFHWVWDDMIQYNVKEQTVVNKFEFNDKNNMLTGVELALDYNLNPTKVNMLHVKIDDYNTKIIKTLKSAAKEVIPQFSAIELNITKRDTAEIMLANILKEELPEFYVEFARVQMTDVDIPVAVSQLAEQTAKQIGKNKLAKEKEAEQVALAKAKVAEADGNYKAGILNAKTKALLAKPEILKLKELEVRMEFAKRGISPYGNNNVFGAGTSIIKGLK